MFMVKRLYEKVVAPTPAKAELATIDGCFYLVRPTVTVKGAKECIFQTAIASIRRTSQPYQYELVVCRSATEEEAELLEEEDVDNIDEYVSLIDPHMDFKIQPASEADSDKAGAVALTWLDLAGEEEDSFLLVVEGASKSEMEAFELIMYRCMWERQHNADGRDVKKDELLQYRLATQPTPVPTSATPSKQETPQKSKKPLFRAPSPSSSDDEVADELTAHIAKLQVSSDNSRPSPSPPKTSNTATSGSSVTTPSSKGKGKAKEEPSPAPVMYPVVPANDDEEEVQLPTSTVSPARVKKEEPEPASPADAAPTTEEITNATYDPPDDRKLMISEECDLNLFDKATGMFMLQEANVVSSLWVVKGQRFTCWLSIAGKDGFIWVSTPVDANLPLHFEESHSSVIISFENAKTGQNFTWLMRYNERDTYLKMNHAFTQGIFEANNGQGTWSKLKPEEQKYNTAAYEIGDVEMEGAEPWNPEEDEEYAEQDALRAEEAARAGDRFGEEELYDEEEEGEEEETEESEEEEDELDTGRKKPKNSLLTVGYKGMSFVVRGDMIGVFENQKGQGKKLKFMTNISGIRRPGSKSTFVPNKVMLHDQDQAMILSDPMNPNAVYKLDLETGTVTDEWKISDDIAIRNFLPESKYAQKTGEQTFVGSSRNAVFKIDPRLSKSKLVDSTYKDYKSPFDFTAGVTTADGKLAFATNKGEIKLFDRLGIRAKTAFAQIGREITGMDVTADGRYIVATTANKLLFIDTSIKEGKNAGRTGFDAATPAADRPQIHALALRPEHAAYMTGGVNFTPAKFNVGDAMEKTIVTSTGPYIVTWNFRAIKAGRFTEYKIKRYDEEIVADNFTWGNDRDIVVTMANDMRIEAKSSLMAPSRQSLQAGTSVPKKSSGIRRGKSSVVREWDE